jgi:UPF0176 protein
MSEIVVAALYHFARLQGREELQTELQKLADSLGVKGSLLLAEEGINGTIAGPRFGIDQVLLRLRTVPGFETLEHKESPATEMPFLKMKVRLKAEIVTMGQPHVDPTRAVGAYVAPEDWNALISRDDVVTIDTRNDYEVAIGSFDGAVDPETKSFRDFPDWWAQNKSRFKDKKVAMFCTGGIRCEKASNYLLGEGVEDVFHLKGGILKYLETIPKEESLWQGSCFVFDQRVSLEHGLEEGPHALCFACRRPLAPADLHHDAYEEGVSCHHCLGEKTEEQRDRFRERQKQIALAAKRGVRHIG